MGLGGATATGVPDLVSAVGSAQRALTAALVRELSARGFADLSPAYAAILPLIDPAGTRQVTLARRAGLTKQAVGQLVRELDARGYLETVADPSDGRARLVRFTSRGSALRTAGLEAKRALWSRAAAAVGDEAAAALTRDLHALAAALAPGRSGPEHIDD